jgi:uncharacterized membrane protein
MDRRLGEGRARAAFIDRFLRLNEVGSIDDLPVEVLADMFNQLRQPAPPG